jgi:hypothetical protein
MIKLKNILLENEAPDIFVPRRIEDRFERLIKNYLRDHSKESLILSRMNLDKLPKILKNLTIGGDFWCTDNHLTSLENSPIYVVGNFGCSHNKLISLEGAPEYVGGNFYCRGNPVRFTEAQVRAVSEVKGKIFV